MLLILTNFNHVMANGCHIGQNSSRDKSISGSSTENTHESSEGQAALGAPGHVLLEEEVPPMDTKVGCRPTAALHVAHIWIVNWEERVSGESFLVQFR
jgi:hypothetical protein